MTNTLGPMWLEKKFEVTKEELDDELKKTQSKAEKAKDPDAAYDADPYIEPASIGKISFINSC